jgi:hypothetical protein
MKTIKTFKRADGLVKTVVKFDEEYSEYQVFLYRAGKQVKAATYHTDDEADALGTAQLMIKA